jgi:hypothetical protein
LKSSANFRNGDAARNVPRLSAPIGARSRLDLSLVTLGAVVNLKNKILQFCFAQNLEEFLEASL